MSTRRAAVPGGFVALLVALGIFLGLLVGVIICGEETESRPAGTSCQDLRERVGLAHDEAVALARDLRSVAEDHAAMAFEEAAAMIGVDVCGAEG